MNRKMLIVVVAFGIAISAGAAAPAFATGEILSVITPADQQRLNSYAKTREAALGEARAGGGKQELAELDKLISASDMDFQGMDLTGEWQCRTLKVGKNLPLVVYGWFRCRVTDDGSGWQLEKLSGSQKTKGRFFDDGPKRLTYLGAGYVNDNAPPTYGGGPQADQAGYAFRTGENAWRIEFPEPYYESKLDILEFRR